MRQLERAKQFYMAHPIASALRTQFNWMQYRFEKLPDENPTVGVLLCTDKNDALVKITLPEDNKNILTSKYQLYIPSENDLLKEIKEVIKNVEKDR